MVDQETQIMLNEAGNLLKLGEENLTPDERAHVSKLLQRVHTNLIIDHAKKNPRAKIVRGMLVEFERVHPNYSGFSDCFDTGINLEKKKRWTRK